MSAIIAYETLTTVTRKDADRMNALLVQLSKNFRKKRISDFERVLKQPNLVKIVARTPDRDIVGMQIMFIQEIDSAKIAFVEDVVTDERYRRQGIAENIWKRLFAFAKTQRADYILLHSNNARTAAHAMYRKLGGEPLNATLFKFSLK